MEKLEKKNKFGTLQLIQEGTLLREGRGGRRFTVIDIVFSTKCTSNAK